MRLRRGPRLSIIEVRMQRLARSRSPQLRRPHQPTDASTIAIIGGGVAGLVAAAALRRLGFNVVLFEQARRLRATGGALLLWTNAVRVLFQLGLRSQALKASTTLDRVVFRSSTGALLSTLPLGALGARLGSTRPSRSAANPA
jgi:2-polyprenyl-6-methoxyphenol hydroxylase-like FAD-dependent oxidoreductase